jgi:hypothetical protein
MPNLCGAKTRAGTPCQKAPIKGSTRCRNHGGKTPKGQNPGNKHAAKPGNLYSKFLTEEEREQFDSIELGKIDDELRLMRIRLARALSHEQARGDKPELDTVTTRQGGGPNTVAKEATLKKRDYVGIIDRIAARIESLERTRVELLKAGEGGGDTPPDPRSFTYNVVDGRKAADGDAH